MSMESLLAPSAERSSNKPRLAFESQSISEKEPSCFHRDLAIASEVQRASFPRQFPETQRLTCKSIYMPAHKVGGDYYDFLRLQDNALGIAIGDVSGKGVAAALVMANLQAALRAQAVYADTDIETIMANLNDLVYEFSPAQFFASLFYGEYHPTTRVMNYVNAGHDAPFVLRHNHERRELLSLKSASVPVGALRESRYTATSFQFEVGDVLVAYTDGVTESVNPDFSPFGLQRLERLLCDCKTNDPAKIIQRILVELSDHSAGCAQIDDITLFVMRVDPEDGTRCDPVAPALQTGKSEESAHLESLRYE
jgi:sigma-B regulation protein RsbU (phosphoserine phosphatase)